MSIYATLWNLKFPRNDMFDDDWIEVVAQGVPGHIGCKGEGYEVDDCAEFLPPAMADVGDGSLLRAVVIVGEEDDKGTARHGQEYVNPLLVLSGVEYMAMTWHDLLTRISTEIENRNP